jgi:CYTH domain-containing protein
MLEREKTYLIKYMPKGWRKSPKKRILDIYYPATVRHPVLRLRAMAKKCELTKKEPVDARDSSRQMESTIVLSKSEQKTFRKLKGKEIDKWRYYYSYEGKTAEISVFEKKLKGLVLVDFEFNTDEEMSAFQMPDFCLADVTEEEFVAGGMLAGKSYKELEKKLKPYGYVRIV